MLFGQISRATNNNIQWRKPGSSFWEANQLCGLKPYCFVKKMYRCSKMRLYIARSTAPFNSPRFGDCYKTNLAIIGEKGGGEGGSGYTSGRQY